MGHVLPNHIYLATAGRGLYPVSLGNRCCVKLGIDECSGDAHCPVPRMPWMPWLLPCLVWPLLPFSLWKTLGQSLLSGHTPRYFTRKRRMCCGVGNMSGPLGRLPLLSRGWATCSQQSSQSSLECWNSQVTDSTCLCKKSTGGHAWQGLARSAKVCV